MMSVFGIDYAWGRPSVAALRKAGVKFVCRYLSHDTSGKNLTRAETEVLSGAGIWIVVVWESGASRALDGRAAGANDAAAAAKQAKACGMPDDRPIYFAVDFDARYADQPKINAYLDGAADVLGRDRVGIYGGFNPVADALDKGKAAWAWQTYAWSGGKWDSRAQLQQYSNDHTISGVGVDFDRAMTDDYGQWKVGESPMAVTDAEIEKIAEAAAEAVWKRDGLIPAPLEQQAGGNQFWQGASYLYYIYKALGQQGTALAQLAQQSPGTVDTQALAQALLAALTPQAIAEAVVAAMPADEAKRVADELAARLAS